MPLHSAADERVLPAAKQQSNCCGDSRHTVDRTVLQSRMIMRCCATAAKITQGYWPGMPSCSQQRQPMPFCQSAKGQNQWQGCMRRAAPVMMRRRRSRGDCGGGAALSAAEVYLPVAASLMSLARRAARDGGYSDRRPPLAAAHHRASVNRRPLTASSNSACVSQQQPSCSVAPTVHSSNWPHCDQLLHMP